MDDFFRQNLASLSGSEAKLLLTMFAVGRTSNAELLRLSGVKDRKTFYDALHRLRDSGWMDMVGKYNLNSWQIQPEWLGNPTIYHYPPLPQLDYPTKELEKPTEVVGEANQDDVSLDFETALEAADGMPSDGDYRITTSNFMQRRKQQLQLLHEAWADLFKQEIASEALKELLQLSHGQSITIYYAMQKAADRKVEFPKGYIKKILQATPAKPEPAQEERLPVTAEDRARWAENEKLLAGYMSGWEG